MNKRLIIIITVILVASIAAISFVFYLLSFKTVTFDIKPENLSITVYNQDDQEVGSFDQSGTLQLQNGDYIVVPSSDTYATNPIGFSVADEDSTITIDPDYSTNYLQELRRAEQAAITKVIRDTYASVIANFTIQPGVLYKKGEWYAGLLVQKPLGSGQNGDTYRVVLKKEGDAWVIQAKPSIVLTSHNHPNIPNDILADINARERL